MGATRRKGERERSSCAKVQTWMTKKVGTALRAVLEASYKGMGDGGWGMGDGGWGMGIAVRVWEYAKMQPRNIAGTLWRTDATQSRPYPRAAPARGS